MPVQRRFFSVFVVVIGAFLVLAPAVLAAGGTPQDICKDLKDGKLDGSYTQQQLQAFQNDPLSQGYCGPIAQGTGQAPSVTSGANGTSQPSAASGVGGHTSATGVLATSRGKGTLPFTGADLGIFAMVGAALVAMGFVLRRTSRE